MKTKLKYLKTYTWLFITGIAVLISCQDDDLPEVGDLPDLTPPSANFVAIQKEGTNLEEDFKVYFITNQSVSSTDYQWEIPENVILLDLDTEDDITPTLASENINLEFPGEGTFEVTLTSSDKLGKTSTITKSIEVIEPPKPDVPDPVLVNADFDKLPKSSGSDCTCSGWINKSIGDQGESSSGNGGSDNVVKFDNNEPDHLYQEFEVVPDSDYTVEIVTSFKSPAGGSFPSMLELRVLAGSGYTGGYTPTYYTDTVDFPQDGFGYSSISQVEEAANNLLIQTQANPNDDGYITYTYSFNSGANNSVALFIRGIGGPATGGGGGDFGYNSGDEEIRADSVTITATN
ncbi:PKD domain-containing protein [Aquimarina sp. 2304DJ70-9]|uniref:PKD domain-containing protein n=1 Tax=Aquimarina penaris TaxID=3231044 RepID=UPI003462093B